MNMAALHFHQTVSTVSSILGICVLVAGCAEHRKVAEATPQKKLASTALSELIETRDTRSPMLMSLNERRQQYSLASFDPVGGPQSNPRWKAYVTAVGSGSPGHFPQKSLANKSLVNAFKHYEQVHSIRFPIRIDQIAHSKGFGFTFSSWPPVIDGSVTVYLDERGNVTSHFPKWPG